MVLLQLAEGGIMYEYQNEYCRHIAVLLTFKAFGYSFNQYLVSILILYLALKSHL